LDPINACIEHPLQRPFNENCKIQQVVKFAQTTLQQSAYTYNNMTEYSTVCGILVMTIM
jgi:hypothetical protein